MAVEGGEVLRDFAGPGRPGPWIAAAAVLAGGLAYFGRWTPWHDWLVLALGSHAGARLLLSFVRRRLQGPFTFATPFAIAVLACAVASVATAAVLRGIEGTWGQSWLPWALDTGFGAAFAGFTILPVLLVRRAEDLRRQRIELAHALELQRETDRKRNLEMELKALQAQIEPHFLYNTLANVQHLLARDPAAADRMLSSLIGYLKSSLPNMRALTTTVDEELAREVLAIFAPVKNLGHLEGLPENN